MDVRVYVKQGCPYSAGAKRLLDEKGIEYHRHVGGYEDLQELDRTQGIRGPVATADPPPA